jgi:hypothetical protein
MDLVLPWSAKVKPHFSTLCYKKIKNNVIVDMSDILGYFGDKRGNPIAYMRQSGLILFSNKKELVKYSYLGDFDFLNRVIISGTRDMFIVKDSKKEIKLVLPKKGGRSHLYDEQQALPKKGGSPDKQQALSKKGGSPDKQQALPKKGGGGFFGESQGSCGWGNNPSCCFTSCAPLWRTTLWPFSDATM